MKIICNEYSEQWFLVAETQVGKKVAFNIDRIFTIIEKKIGETKMENLCMVNEVCIRASVQEVLDLITGRDKEDEDGRE